MVAVFGNTKKNNRKLIIGPYQFVIDRRLKSTTNWRCAKYKSLSCKARATTRIVDNIEKYLVKYPYHTHD